VAVMLNVALAGAGTGSLFGSTLIVGAVWAGALLPPPAPQAASNSVAKTARVIATRPARVEALPLDDGAPHSCSLAKFAWNFPRPLRSFLMFGPFRAGTVAARSRPAWRHGVQALAHEPGTTGETLHRSKRDAVPDGVGYPASAWLQCLGIPRRF
jgi:hypothetical protein